jgi:molybdate transport system substrate-binding protein
VTSFTYAPDGATGEHLAKVIDRLGIAEQVKDKAKKNAPGRVAQVVANGEVELAIGATPSLVSTKGVLFVGSLPAEVQRAVSHRVV